MPSTLADAAVGVRRRVVLADGSRADVEMQARTTPALRSRLVYYATRDHSNQLFPTAPLGYPVDARVERWARFFAARTDAEYEQLASEDPIMAIAKQALDQLSQDPAAHRLARERADAIKLYEFELAASRVEGRAEGEAKLLLKLLALRFGPLSEATLARVRSASVEQLESWGERILSASTLDDVLAP